MMLKMICLNVPSVDQNIVSKHMLFFCFIFNFTNIDDPNNPKNGTKMRNNKKKIKIKIKKIEVL